MKNLAQPPQVSPPLNATQHVTRADEGRRVPRWIFMRLLGGVYLIAFSSLWSQVMGLIGAQGIAPAQKTMNMMESLLARDSARSLWDWPTLFWVSGASDYALHTCCALGVFFALSLIWGWAPRLSIIALWALYLSVFHVASPFLGYQWDTLLLEVSVLAFFYAPHTLRPQLYHEREPSRLSEWMLKLLLFKLIISSGLVKLRSGDTSWQDLTALDYHFWTQPIPHQLSWYAHHLGADARRLGVLLNHFIELCIPWLILFPVSRAFLIPWLILTGTLLGAYLGELSIGLTLVIGCLTALMAFISLYQSPHPRQHSKRDLSWVHTSSAIASAMIVLLMINVALTGNYGFFNLLTIALVFPCVHHRSLSRLIPRTINANVPKSCGPPPSPIWRGVVLIAALFLIPLNLSRLAQLFAHPQISQARALQAQLDRQSPEMGARIPNLSHDTSPALSITQQAWLSLYQLDRESLRIWGSLLLVNSYGLFARMTRERYELIIEGSTEGREWHPYRFKYKPNGTSELHFAGVHMPRLDWQMWFAALYPRCSQRWFFGLLDALLEGSPSVLSLFEKSTFTQTPPRYLRVRRVSAHFTTKKSRALTEQIWTYETAHDYCPIVERPQLRQVNTGRH